MMDRILSIDPVALAGICIGTVCLLFYVGINLYKKNRLDLKHGVMLFLSTSGISAGIKVCFMALDPTLLSSLNGERTYIFLGGLAVIWVSFDMIFQIFKESGTNST